MWDFEYCKTCANNGKVCDPCMQCGEYGTSNYQVISREDDEPSYSEALEGMKSEYPTGDELDAFLNYKRDRYISLRHTQNKEVKMIMISAKEAHDKALSHRVEQSNKVYSKIENLISKEASYGKMEALYFFKPEEYSIKNEVLNHLRDLGYFVEYREANQHDPAELRISWKEAKES